jgi:hypothetical protein
MSPLELRKRLLIAESDLNRAQLVEEWQAMAGNVHALKERARTVGSLARATASLVSGLMFFRRPSSAHPGGKLSWWQTLLKGAQLVGLLWVEFKPRPNP